MNDFEKADQFAQLGNAISDSLQTAHQGNIAKFHNAILEENIRNNKKELKQISTQNRRRSYAFITGLLLLSIIGLLLYRNNRQKQKSNRILQKTLSNLKSAQAQLIQSEKMASLGELTAGIAHEIQNPLNFVNNFSEVSTELIDEMKEELETGTEASVQLANEIADDLKQNLQKINHHGNRASSIVKGMLQHSRTSNGQKELTDINALADEYLRLAYHGMRAKDKKFNADFKTEFDESLPKINVIPQDIGRVLLNLINNAFYACTELQRDAIVKTHGRASLHTPTVTVKTSYLPPSGGMSGAGAAGAVLISVSDNGPGIPSSIIDKIFQPFFTTKPTGSGTGLGLSLSYDIVKAHGGELSVKTPSEKVETTENKGTTFIIQLYFT
jgi:signal transduction histidine kinase